ncbi:hypothetical protein SAMN04487914_101320 [Arthrobacter sp. ok909]|nr:hypothetical protein SAMN04487914_101320 [Arthrobacter sp. ok909]
MASAATSAGLLPLTGAPDRVLSTSLPLSRRRSCWRAVNPTAPAGLSRACSGVCRRLCHPRGSPIPSRSERRSHPGSSVVQRHRMMSPTPCSTCSARGTCLHPVLIPKSSRPAGTGQNSEVQATPRTPSRCRRPLESPGPSPIPGIQLPHIRHYYPRPSCLEKPSTRLAGLGTRATASDRLALFHVKQERAIRTPHGEQKPGAGDGASILPRLLMLVTDLDPGGRYGHHATGSFLSNGIRPMSPRGHWHAPMRTPRTQPPGPHPQARGDPARTQIQSATVQPTNLPSILESHTDMKRYSASAVTWTDIH